MRYPTDINRLVISSGWEKVKEDAGPNLDVGMLRALLVLGNRGVRLWSLLGTRQRNKYLMPASVNRVNES